MSHSTSVSLSLLTNNLPKKEDRITCRNCGFQNHYSKMCKKPITSYGVLLFYENPLTKEIRFLMVCRKHTIGFIQLVRGKYSFYNKDYIQSLFDVLTNFEIDYFKDEPFEKLWERVWSETWSHKSSYHNPKDIKHARDNFNKLKVGYNNISIHTMLEHRMHSYSDPEWGFPKGRPNSSSEDAHTTALREFTEETKIPISDIMRFSSFVFNETYKSYDKMTYRNVYFLYQYRGTQDPYTTHTMINATEVCKFGFYNFEECKSMIRPYYNIKIRVLDHVYHYITNTLSSNLFKSSNLFQKSVPPPHIEDYTDEENVPFHYEIGTDQDHQIEMS